MEALLGVLLFSAVVVGVVSFFGQRAQKARTAQTEQLADILGLRSPGGGILLVGNYGGYTVLVHEEWRGGTQGRGHLYTIVECALDTPLDLGLCVQTASLNSPATSGKPVVLGHAGFDAAFDIFGDDPERVKALLAHGVANALATLSVPHLGQRLLDSGLQIEQRGRPKSDWVIAALDDAVEVLKSVDKARDQIPVAKALVGILPEFEALAAEHGFSLSRAPAGLSGDLDGRSTTIQALPFMGSYHLEVCSRFAKPLRIGLEVEPAGSGSGAALSEHDITTGDPGFDATFSVGSLLAPERVPELLDRSVRALLQQIQKSRVVRVDDEGVTVRAASLDLELLPELVAHAANLSDAIQANIKQVSGNPSTT